jgi:hypothetical protein
MAWCTFGDTCGCENVLLLRKLFETETFSSASAISVIELLNNKYMKWRNKSRVRDTDLKYELMVRKLVTKMVHLHQYKNQLGKDCLWMAYEFLLLAMQRSIG